MTTWEDNSFIDWLIKNSKNSIQFRIKSSRFPIELTLFSSSCQCCIQIKSIESIVLFLVILVILSVSLLTERPIYCGNWTFVLIREREDGQSVVQIIVHRSPAVFLTELSIYSSIPKILNRDYIKHSAISIQR